MCHLSIFRTARSRLRLLGPVQRLAVGWESQAMSMKRDRVGAVVVWAESRLGRLARILACSSWDGSNCPFGPALRFVTHAEQI